MCTHIVFVVCCKISSKISLIFFINFYEDSLMPIKYCVGTDAPSSAQEWCSFLRRWIEISLRGQTLECHRHKSSSLEGTVRSAAPLQKFSSQACALPLDKR